MASPNPAVVMLGEMGPVTTMVVLVVVALVLGAVIHTVVVQRTKLAIERERTAQKRLDVEVKTAEASARTVAAYPAVTVAPDGTVHRATAVDGMTSFRIGDDRIVPFPG